MATAFGPQGPNYSITRPPADPAASAGVDTFFRNCSAAGAKDGTFATADFFNMHLANARYLCRTAGVALNDADDTMMFQAVHNIAAALVAGGASLPNYAHDTGVVNAIALTIPAVATYVEGMTVYAKVAYTNTGAMTININALGAKSIKLGDLTDPAPNNILANEVVSFIYDGTVFQLQNILARNFRQSRLAVFQTPGTFTWVCPADVTLVLARGISGGGGGGGSYGAGAGAGGNGGAYFEGVFPVVPGTSYSVTIGAGGAFGAAGGSAGATGGSTLFASFASAVGGGGGGGGNNTAGGTGAGAYASGAGAILRGGQTGQYGAVTGGTAQGGAGAGSAAVGPAFMPLCFSTSVNGYTNVSGGGGGGGASVSGGGAPGGSGGAGELILTF